MSRILRTGVSPPFRLILLLSAFVFLMPMSCSDNSEPELPMLRENRDATVLIRVNNNSHGTGIAVSHCGYILTNNHVVDGAEDRQIEVYVFGHAEAFEAEVVATDVEHDMAIVHIDFAFQHSAIVETDDSSLNGGDETYSIGFPHDFGQAVSRGYIRQTHFVSEAPDSPPLVNDAMMLRQRMEPGTSGSGIFSVRRGRLVGLMSMNMWGGRNLFQMRTNEIVVPLRHIRAFLDAEEIPYCRPPPPINEQIRDTLRGWLHLD